MQKAAGWIYEKECSLFRFINQKLHHKILHRFFSSITHFGGATFSIASVIILYFCLPKPIHFWAISCMISLIISHIPVAVSKKLYPRKRPYLMLENIHTGKNPLKDHSFPSGHTTAIFSVVIPLILLSHGLWIWLIPLALCVAFSRMYLGLHYPTDVIAGMVLGISSGFLSLFLMDDFIGSYLL